jgi:AbiV family abortive infection protein
VAKKQPTAIPFEALCDGYRLTVLNAFDLLLASMHLMDQPSVGLAVAELGQEELGKSLSILAAAALPSEPEHWNWFWSAWRDHKRKAHRAFLYELIGPVRLEGHSADGARLAGSSMRDNLPAEKEVGFYIDYDEAQAKFVSPADAVGEVESYHRGLTVLYLGLTARAVALTLESRSDRSWYRLFAPVAFRICSERLYQQQMPQLFEEFRSQSSDHDALLKSLESHLASARKELEEMVEGGQHLATSRRAGDA